MCQFRGREIEFKQIALDLFKRFISELKEEGAVESAPSIEGRSMVMVIGPAPAKDAKAAAAKLPTTAKPPTAAKPEPLTAPSPTPANHPIEPLPPPTIA